MHASENMLCQCLYTRNILPDQLLKMRLLEVLEFSQIQEHVGRRALGGGWGGYPQVRSFHWNVFMLFF